MMVGSILVKEHYKPGHAICEQCLHHQFIKTVLFSIGLGFNLSITVAPICTLTKMCVFCKFSDFIQNVNGRNRTF